MYGYYYINLHCLILLVIYLLGTNFIQCSCNTASSHIFNLTNNNFTLGNYHNTELN